MPTVTFILGYCGSGKTHLADEMVRTLGVKTFDEGFAIDPAKRAELIADLRKGTDCAVVEIAFCFNGPREAFVDQLRREVSGVTIKTEYFEADLDKANENCRRRKNKGDAEAHVTINTHRIGSGYRIPPGVTPREIHQLPKES
ncbi:MAG TPA: hypothetical protein VKD72_15150 [Gemmataceae bacterium]|nr:hypothetical protein [Gemmataceae bacterium]